VITVLSIGLRECFFSVWKLPAGGVSPILVQATDFFLKLCNRLILQDIEPLSLLSMETPMATDGCSYSLEANLQEPG